MDRFQGIVPYRNVDLRSDALMLFRSSVAVYELQKQNSLTNTYTQIRDY